MTCSLSMYCKSWSSFVSIHQQIYDMHLFDFVAKMCNICEEVQGHQYVIVEHFIEKPWMLICCCNSFWESTGKFQRLAANVYPHSATTVTRVTTLNGLALSCCPIIPEVLDGVDVRTQGMQTVIFPYATQKTPKRLSSTCDNWSIAWFLSPTKLEL